MILFLDYDGVLHPDAAYLVKGRPELRAEGCVFMWAPILEHASLSRAVHQLRVRGLIVDGVDQDRRRTPLSLTDSGMALVATMQSTYRDVYKSTTARIGMQRTALLIELLDRVTSEDNPDDPLHGSLVD